LLNRKPLRSGKYVLYWMQAAQRAEYNHALEYALENANALKKPLLVLFSITDHYPEANLRHYRFMLEGIHETAKSLQNKGIHMVIRHNRPDVSAVELSADAALVVVDAGHLRPQRKWRKKAAQNIDCALHEVETNLIVPIDQASPKEEFSAGTFRPRISRLLNYYLVPLRHKRPGKDSLSLSLDRFDISDLRKAVAKLRIDKSVPAVDTFHGGTAHAKKHLAKFLSEKLDNFQSLRNDPTVEYVSNMSPYLHFGQISPLYIALQVINTRSPGTDAYLEELIVRRELSHNFVFYNEQYDSFDALPNWARQSLDRHRKDKRQYLYSLKQFEQARTHDPYWNAAQKQMVTTGKMHGYMRMYWGKKILEWTEEAREAFRIALYLNNKYELDGRDANAYTGVAWCFGKHDRAWGQRPVFGKIRYMNAAGLRRKFDPDAYVKKVELLEMPK